MTNFYHILGLKPGASRKEIKRAYFTLAKRLHPDVNPSEDAKKEFIRLNIAYEYLTHLRYRKNPTIRNKAANVTKPIKTNPKANQKFATKGARRAKRKLSEFQKKAAIRILIRDAIRGATAVVFFNFLVVGMMYLSYKADEDFTYERFLFISSILSIGVLTTGSIILGITLKGTIRDIKES